MNQQSNLMAEEQAILGSHAEIYKEGSLIDVTFKKKSLTLPGRALLHHPGLLVGHLRPVPVFPHLRSTILVRGVRLDGHLPLHRLLGRGHRPHRRLVCLHPLPHRMGLLPEN